MYNPDRYDIGHLTTDDNFMDGFITEAKNCYKWTGDYKDMYDLYIGESYYDLSERQVSRLLEYCEQNKLL